MIFAAWVDQKMNNYINKQTAIDTLIKEANEYGACGYVDAFNIEKTLNAMPSVEVIRCKDCAHRNQYRFPPKYEVKDYCEVHEKVTALTNFCSWAERRKDG